MATKTSLLMGDGLRRSATNTPAKLAATDRFREITYGELNARVNQLANGLLSLGIGKGDDVAVMVGNRIEHLEILFAMAKIGALAIPLDIKWKALELGSVLDFFKPRALILQSDCVQELEMARKIHALSFLRPIVASGLSYGGLLDGQSSAEPPVEVHEDDPFAVLLTSGTTGFPKGCLATHRTFALHCINNAIEKGLGGHDKALLSSPIYFNAGRSFTLGIIYFGGTMILHERFDAEEVLKTIEREKVTYIGAVPTMCERMLHVLGSRAYDTSSLRCLAITGGKVHPTVLEDLKTRLTPNIYRTYASTDSGQMAISKPADLAAKPNAAGKPVWCVELRILDDAGNPVKVGEAGEIVCRSPLATHGYYKNPEATGASFRDGWFYTGDLGYFDEEGYLFVAGRKKDMVKSGGISIYPLEIESVLYGHADVLEAAVIGVPDPKWGEAVKAVVVLKPDSVLQGEELIRFCKERLSSYKIPKSVEIRSSLPHTEVGKVNKVKLREMVLAEIESAT
ncbi:MAG: AMP-binding protein [Deltaproteobacteria bacterium]|nr:AMP-binding protein [Deltaproteobacteria bacterium]MBI2365266.1 AMP-binding protein [Deltaproteobacteria bacterium]MBI3063735.1 AMP-binding protein [Deltaproteobacteria bacterium]